MENRTRVHGTHERKIDNDTKVEVEPQDPEEANPAYKIKVTLSPKTFEQRKSRPGDEASALWGPHGLVDTLNIEGPISRQKRYCFFESHEYVEKQKKDKFYAKRENEEFFTWPDQDDNSETFNHIVQKDMFRKFILAFCRRWPAPQHASTKKDITDQYENLLELLDTSLKEIQNHSDTDTNIFDATVRQDYWRITIAAGLAVALKEITINQRWQIVNCLLEACPFVKDHDEAPVFCLEAAGRDEFVVTTYGYAPQQHALFPGVPLQLQSATDLQYTLELHPTKPTRRLVMLDPSLPGDAEE
jgi:hypothetical protein